MVVDKFSGQWVAHVLFRSSWNYWIILGVPILFSSPLSCYTVVFGVIRELICLSDSVSKITDFGLDGEETSVAS